MRKLSAHHIAYIGLFLSGIASAAAIPYQSTIGLEILKIDQRTYSAVIFASGVISVFMSLLIGWHSDRSAYRSRVIIAISLLSGAGIYAFTLFGNTVIFIFCCLLFLPLTSILTQQCFAFLRAQSVDDDNHAMEMRNASGRTSFASAWVLAPAIFIIIPFYNQADLAFLTSASACIASAFLFMLTFDRASAKPFTNSSVNGTVPERQGLAHWAALIIPVLGCGALRAAPRLQQIIMGPIMIREFGGSLADVGYASAIAAVIELPLILLWGKMFRYMSRATMLFIGSLLFAVYFVALYCAQSLMAAYMASIILAFATSSTLSLTISYLQNLLPDRPGLGSSLISVANCLGAALAALVFALFSETSYRECALIGGLIVASGGAAIWLWDRRVSSLRGSQRV
ncbi:MFS transporter [Agrobacterium vitis]|uniref:MFS transporter n=1 Tax=Agrobacterium vitis TaxID=373 RepID=UPI0008722B71|nr:MFS transporter [Agrobacterium vitis]MCE6077186.1 MFS transporter [Agrobacterium vitis]MCM2469092.1 MFS transporter [Agrobacterium vitis]MUO69507.1 MFS transporter [Agrobacterium vitis]MUO87359.1 MFS transporter [Agrobacterium vitis]